VFHIAVGYELIGIGSFDLTKFMGSSVLSFYSDMHNLDFCGSQRTAIYIQYILYIHNAKINQQCQMPTWGVGTSRDGGWCMKLISA